MRTILKIISKRLEKPEAFTVLLAFVTGVAGEYAVYGTYPDAVEVQPLGSDRRIMLAAAHIVSAEIIEG